MKIGVYTIDLDFGDIARDKVVEYVTNKHGKDKVCSLGAFQYVWAKGAIKDIGKVLGIPYAETDKITKSFDGSLDFKEVMESGVIDQHKKTYPELFDYCEKLSGLPKSFGVHPCFTKGHLVATKDGYKKIEDINVGDLVLTHKNNYKQVVFTDKEVKGGLRKLKITSGEDIVGTYDHPFYVKKSNQKQYDWIEFKHIEVGDLVFVPKSKKGCKVLSNVSLNKVDTVYKLTVLDDCSYTVNDVAVHNCGKVISNSPILELSAVDLTETMPTLMLDMHEAEDLGMVKFDFLGLRTVDAIYNTLKLIGKDYNYIAPHSIDFDDDLVWDEFEKGHTDMIFQFSSEGMKKTLKNMKARSILDLTAANALYRPGSMAFIPDYTKRKSGEEDVVYLHPDLEDILKPTYGIIVFQEQLIEIGRLANMTNPDLLRKATGELLARLV